MPAKRCQSFNKKNNQCGLTTKTGDFCWRHALCPRPIPSYQSATPTTVDPRPTAPTNPRRPPATTPQNSSEDVHEIPNVRGGSSKPSHNISASEGAAPAVIIAAGVGGSAATPALDRVVEIGEVEPGPLRRVRTWRDLVPRQLRASISSGRGSNVNTSSNQLQPENIVQGMGFSPKTQRELLAYLEKTREIKEHLYISCSSKNSRGERRIKIGRTADPHRRRRDYARCDMEIVWSMQMEHTNRLERLVLMGIKSDFKELGRRGGVPCIQEIQALGRKVVCPCGKSHNDMFLTTSHWDDTHMDGLKNLIFEFSRLERIESENLLKVEALEVTSGEEVGEVEVEDGEERAPVREKGEERAAEIHVELVRAQRPWVRGPDGRLIRAT